MMMMMTMMMSACTLCCSEINFSGDAMTKEASMNVSVFFRDDEHD